MNIEQINKAIEQAHIDEDLNEVYRLSELLEKEHLRQLEEEDYTKPFY